MADNGANRTERSSSHGAAPDNPSRRLSYASVVTGAPSHGLSNPMRSGAFAHMTTTASNASYPPQYQSEDRISGRLQGHEQEYSSHNTGHHGGRMSTLPASSRKYANMASRGTGSFFVPSYLKNSRYVSKLEAAWLMKARTFRDHATSSGSHHGLLPSSSSSNPRLAPSHRGMTYDVIENNPPIEDDLMPLPSRWNSQDKYPGLDLMSDGLDVRYSGTAGKAELEAAAVRSDFPMSPQCGIYYYEITIKQKNKECAVAIGFSNQKSSLERLPGWEPDSWAYHGDDGKAFWGEQQGRTYAPEFGAGDVVGCGVNFRTGQAFFTKNGQDLGIAFRDLANVPVFPCVGMKKYSGALVSVNFGQHPFTFDIGQKMVKEESMVRAKIDAAKTDRLHPGQDSASFAQDLVAQFLSHAGFIETAKAFQEQVEKERSNLHGDATHASSSQISDTSDARARQHIRQAILKGEMDSALEMIQQTFPNLLEASPQMLFKLQCRKWVEIIAKAADLRRERMTSVTKNKRASNGVSGAAVNDVFDQAMELDEEHTPAMNGNGKEPAEAVAASVAADSPEITQLNQDAIQYGQTLQAEYGNMGEEYSTTLREIFSLIPYLDPRQSINGHLLDSDGRAKVAEELNSAILESLGKAPAAALETAWRQTESLIDILSQDGGSASFINLQKDFGR